MSGAVALFAVVALAGGPSRRPSPAVPGRGAARKVAPTARRSAAASPPVRDAGAAGRTAPPGAVPTQAATPLGTGRPSSAQSPEAKTYEPVVGSRVVAPEELHVGDVFEVRVTVVHRPEVSVNLPARLDLGRDLTVLEHGRSEPVTLDNGKVKEEFWVRVAAFRTGRIELPDLEVVYSYPKGKGTAVATVRARPGAVEVAALTANEPNPDLKPDEAPVPVYVENRTAKYVALGVVAALLGALAALLLYRLLRGRLRKPEPPPPPRPPHLVALEALDRIAASGMLDRGELREFYFAVSEVVRKYLGDRFGFDSLEMTTTELLDALRKVPLVGITLEEVEAFSAECDLVKFAKYVPSREEAEAILAKAYELVHKSSLVVTPPPQAGHGTKGEGSGADAGEGGAAGVGGDEGVAEPSKAPADPRVGLETGDREGGDPGGAPHGGPLDLSESPQAPDPSSHGPGSDDGKGVG